MGDHVGYLDELWALVGRCRREARNAGVRRRPRKAVATGTNTNMNTRTNMGTGTNLAGAAGATQVEEIKKKDKPKKQARGPSQEEDVVMWRERGARLGLIIASEMVEMKEYEAAAGLLEPLLAWNADVNVNAKNETTPGSGSDTAGALQSTTSTVDTVSSQPALRSAIARIYLQAGMLARARAHFGIIEQDPDVGVDAKAFNGALLAAAEGDWDKVAELLQGVRGRAAQAAQGGRDAQVQVGGGDADADGLDTAGANNLAVALLARGQLSEAIEVLEEVMRAEPAGVAGAEPVLFNLCESYAYLVPLAGSRFLALGAVI
jgi:tetratricopeptide (TPR) repeat protein